MNFSNFIDNNDDDYFGIITPNMTITSNSTGLSTNSTTISNNIPNEENHNRHGQSDPTFALVFLLIICFPCYGYFLFKTYFKIKDCLSSSYTNIKTKCYTCFRKVKFSICYRNYEQNKSTYLDHEFMVKNSEYCDSFDGEDNCPICLDNCNTREKGIIKLSCNHKFHSECLNPWIIKQHTDFLDIGCPLCRAEIKIVFKEEKKPTVIILNYDSDTSTYSDFDY